MNLLTRRTRQGRDHRDFVARRRQLWGVLSGEPSDGNQWHPALLSALVRTRESRQTDLRFGATFGTRSEHGAERHVIRFIRQRSFELFEVMGRYSHVQLWRYLADYLYGQVLLTHMYPVALG